MTASEASISADRIHLGYGPVEIINALSTTIEHGEITALVGPNGSGKSTLLKGLARLINLVSAGVHPRSRCTHGDAGGYAALRPIPDRLDTRVERSVSGRSAGAAGLSSDV